MTDIAIIMQPLVGLTIRMPRMPSCRRNRQLERLPAFLYFFTAVGRVFRIIEYQKAVPCTFFSIHSNSSCI